MPLALLLVRLPEALLTDSCALLFVAALSLGVSAEVRDGLGGQDIGHYRY